MMLPVGRTNAPAGPCPHSPALGDPPMKRFLAALPARYGLEGAQADDLRPFLH